MNGNGGTGKDTFVSFISKYIPTYKYSIIDLVKTASRILKWEDKKTEKDRKFLSDLMDLSSNYNDAPYQDIKKLVDDFLNDYIEADVLFIDMRDPKDIERAVKDFQAKTILMINSKVNKIESNHADLNVERYNYDYIIENNGTIEQLDEKAKIFVDSVICQDQYDIEKPICF